MTLTKGDIRKIAINRLKAKGFDCWINNNLPVRGRAFIGRKGVADILGFKMEESAPMLQCEVKAGNDKLSEEQHEMLCALSSYNGYAFLAYEVKGQVLIETYLDYIKNGGK